MPEIIHYNSPPAAAPCEIGDYTHIVAQVCVTSVGGAITKSVVVWHAVKHLEDRFEIDPQMRVELPADSPRSWGAYLIDPEFGNRIWLDNLIVYGRSLEMIKNAPVSTG
jgi:hypothetical protein